MTTTTGLSGATRFAYGFGLSAEGIKNNAFNYFLLFYYQQIAGLDPLLCGLALLISLCIDAVADPAIGVWSDGVRSKLGRRHPFMFAAGLPLALSFVAVFMPPAGMSQALLFCWLLVFACGTRVAMSLFTIPHSSLVAELSRDYDERTRLNSLRTVFAWIFGLINAVLAFRVFLAATPEYPIGLANPAGYPAFAVFGAVVMLLTTLISSAGTLRRAREVQPDESQVHVTSLSALPRAVMHALSNRNYRTVVMLGLCGAMSFGMAENLGNYINTYFWGFTSEQLSVFVLVIFCASLFVLTIAGKLAARFGKRNVAIAGAVIPALNTPLMVLLKVLGLLPAAGSQALLLSLCVSVFVGYSGIILGMVMVGSMIADVTDEYELETGKRQEGLMFSAVALIAKASSGLGVMLAGVLVKAVGFPERATAAALDPAVPMRLALLLAAVILVLGVISYNIVRRYGLDRAAHDRILQQLAERGHGAASSATAVAQA